MEKNKQIQIYCLFAASLFLGIFGAVCLYLGVVGEYNDAMGYFSKDSVFAPVAYICMAAGPVFGIVGWVLCRNKEACDKALFQNAFVKVSAFLVAALILFSVVTDVVAVLNAAVPTFGARNIAYFAVAILCAASLIVSTFSKKDEPVAPVVSLLSFAPVIYCAMSVLYLYFDQSVAVNSPVKLISQLTYLSFMLVFCAETGLSLGRGKLYSRYLFALCCGVAVGGVGAISALVVTLTGAPCVALTGADSFVKAGLFLYACARLVCFTKIETAADEEEYELISVVEEVESAEEAVEE